ncbi:MAG: HAMP domain-containing histidine kinase [Lachnospiraceae bacterium]|nr:HAMP domain-containing histidine kinase [Lachnospiraceae bacterium]
MLYFIKNFGIITCCIYFFVKLLHLSITKKSFIVFSSFAMALTIFSIALDSYCPYAAIPILYLVLITFFTCQTREQLTVVVTSATISFALSYTLFTAAAMISGTLCLALPENYPHFLPQLFCCIIQLLLMLIPFRFNRLKKGMPFLRKSVYAIPGTIISSIILCTAVLLNTSTDNLIYLIPMILLIILGILIYVYWKNNLTKTYIDKLNQKNIESLNADLLEKQQQIDMLTQDNQRLSKIIHKDNKLIPAMEYAVERYIKDSSLSARNEQIGAALLEDLKRLAGERKGMILSQEKQCEQLPLSNVTGIDSLLHYMQQKAMASDISLHVTLDCEVSNLIGEIIEESTLKTLLADLLDNAIIASRYNNGQHILLNIGFVSQNYAIHVFDSGIPFTKEVLLSLGKKQITTHADDSGSGIGMMQTYEILKQYEASLLIDEFTPDTGLYTKKVSVVFNRRHQYTLYTTRNRDEITYLSQRGDLRVVEK